MLVMKTQSFMRFVNGFLAEIKEYIEILFAVKTIAMIGFHFRHIVNFIYYCIFIQYIIFTMPKLNLNNEIF